MRLSSIAVPVGAIIFLVGLVWMFQGVGVLPGSIMTGSQFWAFAGALTLIIGVAVALFGLKWKPKHSKN
jgi:hypothetical protein